MNNRAVNLVEERIDLALRITNELDPNLIARPLSTCASVVCAAPAYLAAHGTLRQPQDFGVTYRLTYSYFGKSLGISTHRGEIGGGGHGNLSANESVVLMAGAVQGRAFPCSPTIRRRRCWPAATGGAAAGYRPQSMGHLRHLHLAPPDACHLAYHADFLVGGSPAIRSGRRRCAEASATFPRRFHR